jgi:serine/threonine-protein kinase
VPAAVEAIVARCLSRDPAARYQTVGELADALRPFASDQMRALMAARQSSPGLVSAKLPPAPTLPMVAAAKTADPGTSAPWASTGADDGPTGLPDPRRGRVVAMVAAGIVVLLVGGIGAGVAMRRVEPAAGPAGLTIDSPTPATAAPTSSAAVQPQAAGVDAESPRLERVPVPVSAPSPRPTPPPPSRNAPASVAAVAPPPPPAAAPVPAPPPPPAAPAGNAKNCSPNYYFDNDGHKHFKPECF